MANGARAGPLHVKQGSALKPRATSSRTRTPRPSKRERLVGDVDENVSRIQRMAKTLEYVARRGRWPEDAPTVRYGNSEHVYADVRVKAAQASIEASAKLLGYLGVKEPEKTLTPDQVRAAADALYGLSLAEDDATAPAPAGDGAVGTGNGHAGGYPH
jgi:hypothetical protein